MVSLKRKLLAAAICLGALGALVPLTSHAESGAAERSAPATRTTTARTKAKQARTTAHAQKEPQAKEEQKPVPAKAKALVKSKSLTKKFLPLKHVGDY
jgi:hypothetical protein